MKHARFTPVAGSWTRRGRARGRRAYHKGFPTTASACRQRQISRVCLSPRRRPTSGKGPIQCTVRPHARKRGRTRGYPNQGTCSPLASNFATASSPKAHDTVQSPTALVEPTPASYARLHPRSFPSVLLPPARASKSDARPVFPCYQTQSTGTKESQPTRRNHGTASSQSRAPSRVDCFPDQSGSDVGVHRLPSPARLPSCVREVVEQTP